MEISRVAIKAPRAPAVTAIQSLTEAFASRPWERASGAFATILGRSAMGVLPLAALVAVATSARVHLDADGKARNEDLARLLVRIDADPHRHALHDLREIAGGILRRQQCEL